MKRHLNVVTSQQVGQGKRLWCRLAGHAWHWQWTGVRFEYLYCARCGREERD